MRGPGKTRRKTITRIDHAAQHGHGYQVCISWKGGVNQEFFSDEAHRGRLEALTAAVAWRDKTERLLGCPEQPAPGMVSIHRSKCGDIEVFDATRVEPLHAQGGTAE